MFYVATVVAARLVGESLVYDVKFAHYNNVQTDMTSSELRAPTPTLILQQLGFTLHDSAAERVLLLPPNELPRFAARLELRDVAVGGLELRDVFCGAAAVTALVELLGPDVSRAQAVEVAASLMQQRPPVFAPLFGLSSFSDSATALLQVRARPLFLVRLFVCVIFLLFLGSWFLRCWRGRSSK